MAMKCAHCGKMVDKVCSICWRCKDCGLDCSDHMKRTINGVVAKAKGKS